ncbi:hypothetical protein F4860DRAFT_398723 [Xylaria cubensis]|nr:hypothetical protein F4860DRAFT_398723 [Xylaria cubensis]
MRCLGCRVSIIRTIHALCVCAMAESKFVKLSRTVACERKGGCGCVPEISQSNTAWKYLGCHVQRCMYERQDLYVGWLVVVDRSFSDAVAILPVSRAPVYSYSDSILLVTSSSRSQLLYLDAGRKYDTNLVTSIPA